MSRKRRAAVIAVKADDAVDQAIAYLERVIGHLENEIAFRRAAVDAIKAARGESTERKTE